MGAGVQQPQMQQPGMSGKGSSQQQMPQQGYGGKGGQQKMPQPMQQMQLLQQRQQMPQQGYGGKGGQQLAPDQLQQLQAQMGNFSAPPAQQPMRQQPMPKGNFTPDMSRDAFAQEYFGNNMTVGAPSFANQQVDAAYDRFQQQTPMQQQPSQPLPAFQPLVQERSAYDRFQQPSEELTRGYDQFLREQAQGYDRFQQEIQRNPQRAQELTQSYERFKQAQARDYDQFLQQQPSQPLPAFQPLVRPLAQPLAQRQLDAQNIPPMQQTQLPAERAGQVGQPAMMLAPRQSSQQRMMQNRSNKGGAARRPETPQLSAVDMQAQAMANQRAAQSIPPAERPPLASMQRPSIPAGAQIGRREPMQPALQPSKNNPAMRGLGIGALLGRGLR